MNLIIDNLQIPVELDGMDQYLKAASRTLEMNDENLSIVKILSKELDLSNKEQFYFKLSIVVGISGYFDNKKNFPEYIEKTGASGKSMDIKARPIIIGDRKSVV